MILRLDEASFSWLDELRQRHFPPERSFLRAHLTLFHKLPGEEVEAVLADLGEAASERREPLPLAFPEPMFLGRGVAVRAESEPLVALRNDLARRWQAWLSGQDRQPFRPHVTVQNKVPADQARALFETLAADWTPRHGAGLGLSLHRYLGGPWERVADVPFAG